ncbi:hypothetical protein K432DRAFT_299972, partial [Lepidopterella palustris CBS 459.81]
DVQLYDDQLRVAVKEAWESITKYQLKEFNQGMKKHCVDVVKTSWGHTKWSHVI